jgi:hypothetical protein
MKQGRSLYKHQLDNKKKTVCTLHFTMCLKLIIWSVPVIHKRRVHVLPLAAFKCPMHKTVHLSNSTLLFTAQMCTAMAKG